MKFCIYHIATMWLNATSMLHQFPTIMRKERFYKYTEVHGRFAIILSFREHCTVSTPLRT